MSSTDAAILDAILAAPDDDRPRLVYADRLIERGDVRGELIHLQCAARKDAAMIARESELLRLHRESWERPLRSGRVSFHWSRGFPEALIGDGGGVLDSLAQASRLAPIKRLTLTSGGAYVRQLARRPELQRIAHLEVSSSDALPDQPMDDADAHALADSAQLGGLTGLTLGATALTHAGIRALAGAPWLARLTRLSFGRNRVEVGPLIRRAVGLEALSVSGALLLEAPFSTSAPLTQLALNDCGLRRGTGAVLARSHSLARLTSLALTQDELDAEDVVHLAHGQHFGALRELKLSQNAIGDDGAAALATAPRLAGLLTLELRFGSIQGRGIAALAGSTTLAQLRRLNLSGNPLWPAWVDALARGKGLPSLRELVISESDVPEPLSSLRLRFAGKPQLVLLGS